jgi:hypothetical protein
VALHPPQLSEQMNNRSVGCRSSETYSHPIRINNNNKALCELQLSQKFLGGGMLRRKARNESLVGLCCVSLPAFLALPRATTRKQNRCGHQLH